MRAQARVAAAVETALMRRWLGAASFAERERSIASVAAEQEIPAYAAQLEEEYRYDGVWELRCPGFLRIGEIAALPDRSLLAWVDRLSGLRLPKALAVVDEAPEFSSAWRIAAEVWMTQTLAEPDQDLLGLLAVEVWKRRRPDRPCLEVLLDEEFAAHLACLADAGRHLGRYLAFVRRVFPLLQGESFDDATLGGESASHLVLCVARLAKLSLRAACTEPAQASDGMAEALRWYDRLPVRRGDLRGPFARILAEGLEALGRSDEAERLRRRAELRRAG
ncbi:hypothetical protein [Nannocystis sp. SCPEA4]|uniref:hypothetical protein n=1 Tax=Nannocystis sp. SCPEA4 TaxID=2996787 RepID=UPI0022700CEA|nr:hypothetical protein [Nannocystis sp. SCPEA4]MCY1061413.1 hypothetical protein [Nannocystis sp. SCPEA4]